MSGMGGRRAGAGRKKGSLDKLQGGHKTAAKAAKKILRQRGEAVASALAEFDTPLEVMIDTMIRLRDEARLLEAVSWPDVVGADGLDAIQARAKAAHDLRMEAVEVASKAAPYMHARLASIEANVNAKFSLYEESLLELAGDAVAGG